MSPFIACSVVYLVRLKETRENLAMKKISKHRVNMQQQLIPLEQDFADPFVAGLYSTFQTEVIFFVANADTSYRALFGKLNRVSIYGTVDPTNSLDVQSG